MSTAALGFILLSALFHALWNVILKTSQRKLSFNILMHFSAVFLFSIVFLLWQGRIPLPPFRLVVLAISAGFFFALYHLCLTVSYETTDVSLAYPLTTTGPLYIPLWAYVFIGERISPLGGAGIVLVFLGAWAIQVEKVSLSGMLAPFRNLKNPGVLLALAAGFFYSIGAVIDKKGVSGFDVFVYTYYLDFILGLFLLINLLLVRGGRSEFLAVFREEGGRVLLAGAILFGSFITYRLGLKMARVSYAASSRQVNALFGVLLGAALFREKFWGTRLVGALLIAVGVALIKIG
ncbi:MAG: EamA family transporter [Deltaproteobacteria bacterium]|nr:MAG: EamA family transporter [Deltaproteobacteria bacterium]